MSRGWAEGRGKGVYDMAVGVVASKPCGFGLPQEDCRKRARGNASLINFKNSMSENGAHRVKQILRGHA